MTRGRRPVVPRGLTDAQATLLERHARGVRRVAAELATKNAMKPTDIMFTLADRQGAIGRALGAALPRPAIGPVVLPGRATELEAWVERLAVHAPVWDFTDGTTGIPVIVIDAHDVMAVVRLGEQS